LSRSQSGRWADCRTSRWWRAAGTRTPGRARRREWALNPTPPPELESVNADHVLGLQERQLPLATTNLRGRAVEKSRKGGGPTPSSHRRVRKLKERAGDAASALLRSVIVLLASRRAESNRYGCPLRLPSPPPGPATPQIRPRISRSAAAGKELVPV
jgi:hypothetical protein